MHLHATHTNTPMATDRSTDTATAIAHRYRFQVIDTDTDWNKKFPLIYSATVTATKLYICIFPESGIKNICIKKKNRKKNKTIKTSWI